MYNTLKCVETLGNIPSLIFKTLGQLENVPEPFCRSAHWASMVLFSFHPASLEILSPSLRFKQDHVSPASFTSKKIKANHQYEHSSMETKGMVVYWCPCWSPVICSVFWLAEPTRRPRGLAAWLLSWGGGGKKKFSLYLRLFLDKKKKRNGLCNQMLETVIGFFAIVQRVCPKHLGLLGAAERRCRQHFWRERGYWRIAI